MCAQAFKFPDVMDLTLECNVELCKTECESCPIQGQVCAPGNVRPIADTGSEGPTAVYCNEVLLGDHANGAVIQRFVDCLFLSPIFAHCLV